MPATATTRLERYELARAFLHRVDPTAKFFTIQTFDDSQAKRGALATIVHIDASDAAFNSLAELNDRGAGIFFCVNQTDGKGRQAQNVVRVRALFVDLDGAPLADVLDCGARSALHRQIKPR